MPKKVVTEEHREFAIQNYLKFAATDIDKKFGVSKGCTSRIYKKLGIAVPRDLTLKFRSEKFFGKTTFTAKEDKFIRRNYLTMPVKRMATTLGRSDVGVRGRLKAMNLVIPREIVEQRKMDSRIKPGSTPPNKGKKMPPELYEKAKATMFKKGHIPQNVKYDGHEYITTEGYVYIRISMGKYVLKHRLIWEKVNGPVPKVMF